MNKKCQDAAEAKTVHNEAVKDTLEKTETLEKLVKTVTVRAESLSTTEADFFQTLLEHQVETWRNFNELFVELGHTRSTQEETRRTKKTST